MKKKVKNKNVLFSFVGFKVNGNNIVDLVRQIKICQNV